MKTNLTNFGLFANVVKAAEELKIGSENAYLAFRYLNTTKLGETARRVLYAYMERYVRMIEGRCQNVGGQDIVWKKHGYIRCPESYLEKVLRDRSTRTIRRARKELIDHQIIVLTSYQKWLALEHDITDSSKYIHIRQEVLDSYHLIYLYKIIVQEPRDVDDLIDRFEVISLRLGRDHNSLIFSIGRSCPMDKKIMETSRTKIKENVLLTRTKLGKNVLVKELYTLLTKVYFSKVTTEPVPTSEPIGSSSDSMSSTSIDDLMSEIPDDGIRSEMRKFMKPGARNVHMWHRLLYYQLQEDKNKPLREFMLRIKPEHLPNYDVYQKKIMSYRFFYSFRIEPIKVWERLVEKMSSIDMSRRKSFTKLISDTINMVHEEMREKINDPNHPIDETLYCTYLHIIPERLRNKQFIDVMEQWFDHCRELQLGMSLNRTRNTIAQFEEHSQEQIEKAIKFSIGSSYRKIILGGNDKHQSRNRSIQDKNREVLNLRDKGSRSERSKSGSIDLASIIRDRNGEKNSS